MTQDDVYEKLAEKYHLAGDNHFLDLLQILMTPEEGVYLLEASTPKTPAELAELFNLDEKTVAAKMDNLARRGLLFRGETQYLAWMDAHQLKARVKFSADEYTPPGLLEHRRRDERFITSPYAEIHLWLKLFEMTGKPLIFI